MAKEGKVDILSVLILSILIFVIYAVFVLGAGGIDATFPENSTNASATFGFSPSQKNASFNGTNPSFHCVVNANGSDASNITNVSLFIDLTSQATATATKNQTLNSTVIGTTPVVFIFNVTTVFNEGTYFWFCESENNVSGVINYNTTINRTFIIDKTPPFFARLRNLSSLPVSTGDTIHIAANFSDGLTAIQGVVSLLVNLSGTGDNEVNNTNSSVFSSGVVAARNGTQVNLSFVLPGHALGQVLNFTLRVNDSVGNVNITTALVFTVTGDATPPAVNLTLPINLFNQSNTTAPDFEFVAQDNNNSLSFNLTCGINISLGGSIFASVTPITATNGSPQVNTTTIALSNGSYTWNVSCTDPAGNSNTSLSRTFVVDQIPPVEGYFNLTNGSILDVTGDANAIELGLGDAVSRAQGDANTGKIYARANWTDNLTQPFEADFQFFNTTSESWQTINTTVNNDNNNITLPADGGWSNFTYTIPSGHNVFEGRNVSFRIYANDTLGNINKSNNVRNFTIQINDTTNPTIVVTLDLGGSQVGDRATNGTNISDTTPTIVWNVTEGSHLNEINISIDGVVTFNDACNKFKKYTTAADFPTTSDGAANANRNGSVTISPTGNCPLANGTRVVRVTTVDSWGNLELYIYSFSLQSGSIPSINLSSIQNHTSGAFPNGIAGDIAGGANQSNITPYTALNFTGLDGATSKIRDFSWTSSCPASETVSSSDTTFTASNLSYIWPFNFSGCKGTEANQTVSVTMADVAGNSVTNLFQFAVDDKGPTIAVTNPLPNSIFINTNVSINVSAFDGMNRVESIVYYLDGSNVGTSHTTNGTITAAQGQNSSLWSISVNFTAGTHTIKIRVNDTLGNARNSSVITFTQVTPLAAANEINTSITSYLNEINPADSGSFNVTLRLKNGSRDYNDLGSDRTPSNQTFEIFIATNTSSANDQINVTLTDINGSGANWDKINFSLILNDSGLQTNIESNWTNNIFYMVSFNESIDEFLSDPNDYYGTVLLPTNISRNGTAGGLNQEIWWFPNEGDLTDRRNVSECGATNGGAATFSATRTTACWNYTSGGTLVQVPHFSVVIAVNDSGAPTITVETPQAGTDINQTVSMFKPNITVTSDTQSCTYQRNGSSTHIDMTLVGTSCIGQTERYNNSANLGYNITFNATDRSGNVQSANFFFNVTDNTAPDNGIITTSAIASTSSSVVVTGANESVNVTVNYGTSNTSLTSRAHQTDFNITQTVSLTSLTASKKYFYNVSVCDFNGNCRQNNTVFTFTTSAAGTTTTTTTTTGGASGSGGGGAVVSNIQASKAQVWASIPSGASASLKVDKADIAVTKVTIIVNAEVTNVELSVSSLKDKPVSSAAAAKVYQYLKITKNNIKDAQADKITVAFRVPKTWLDENGLASADIALYRYKDQLWNRISVTVTGTDDTYVNYAADVPGLSFFAIGSKAAAEGLAFEIIDAIREFYAGTSSLTAFDIIDKIRAFYGG